MLDENMSDDELLSGKSDSPHWDIPKVLTLNVHFVLYQNQVWVNRPSLLQFFENEIEIIKANHVPGINNYWDVSKIEYLRHVQEMLGRLQPGDADRSID